MDKPSEYFVVILENDGVNDGDGFLFMESYLKHATKAGAHQTAKRMEAGGKHGKSLIGRVTIEECDQVNPPQIVADLLRREDSRIAELIMELDQIGCHTSNQYAAKKNSILEWLRNL